MSKQKSEQQPKPIPKPDQTVSQIVRKSIDPAGTVKMVPQVDQSVGQVIRNKENGSHKEK